jgi:DNA segregation ATPase FtsK/SpoIIIE-like protein
MTDRKPSRPATPNRPSSTPRTTASKTGSTAKPTTAKSSGAVAGTGTNTSRSKTGSGGSKSSQQLVRSDSRTTSQMRREIPSEPEFHPMLDPERLGKLLHDRPAWLEELFAIALIVFGFVSIFSLLNTSPTAALSNLWSDAIRQLFGYVGALFIAGMIIAVGVLIVLPRIGIRVPLNPMRVILIEASYFAMLAILHISANDPEPRALAHSGLGGGYIGWALSEPLVKLFGAGMAETIYVLVIIFSLGRVVGLKRKHIRDVLTAISKGLESFAERMKRPPETARRNRQARPAQVQPIQQPTQNGASSQAAYATAPTSVADSTSAYDSSQSLSRAERAAMAYRSGDSRPSSRPSTPAPAPTPTVASGPLPASAIPTPPIQPVNGSANPAVNPASQTGSRPASKPSVRPAPRPVVPERRRRYFTVEDFKEIRQGFPRVEGLPPLSVLNDIELNKPTEQEINNNVRIIENTLLEFDIDVEVVDVKVGPTVTQYAVQPFREVTNDQGEVVMQRVRVNKIASLTSDLALALSAKRLRIQPYVPGHPYMGIEVPNRQPSTVALRPVMESETFARTYVKRDPDSPSGTREVPLTVPLGRDVSGAAFVVDLATMPHLLIAGTTGSGKSVCITAMTLALVMNNTPDRMNLVMLDPKMVELTRFNGLPHLLGPVETDIERIIGVLRWATREMDRRYKLLEVEACRNIEAYNRALGKRRQSEHLPYIVILIDEIGDLMLSRPDEVERTLTRLAQMARAVGIHLVVATQRPSVDIITGLIKANFPARISFAVASGTDSRVILDATGAETLMGRGDMLYLAPDAAGPQRIQGCFVSDAELEAVLEHWRNWKAERPIGDPDLVSNVAPWERGLTRRESLNETDPLLEDAIDLVVREGEASASLIQRRLGIGYPRAAQLLDMLGELGVVGSLKDGGRSREVLLKPGMDKYKKLLEKRRKGG